MTTNAATENTLGGLHNKVATVMVQALDVIDKAQEAYLDNPDLAEVGPAPEVSAPLLSVITKFLNDNKITCIPEESAGLSDLEQRLKNKQKRRKVGNVVQLVADDE